MQLKLRTYGVLMASFATALVRFSPDGSTYPVNNSFIGSTTVGDKVLVRSPSSNTLLVAEITGEDFRPQAPKASIVCFMKDADRYGFGPAAITDQEQLDQFMDVLGYDKFDVEPDPYSQDNIWIFGYAYRSAIFEGTIRSSRVVLIGNHKVGTKSVGNMGGAGIKNGKMILRGLALHRDIAENLFRTAAQLGEGDLVYDTELSDDDDGFTVGDIRRAINGDEPGPAYLGDGVWI